MLHQAKKEKEKVEKEKILGGEQMHVASEASINNCPSRIFFERKHEVSACKMKVVIRSAINTQEQPNG
jgi:hypothetical protein